jgi:hypothetical protein
MQSLAASGGASDDYDDGDGGSSGVCSLVDMLVGSITKFAVAPWLVLVNRWYFETDRRDLAQVKRGLLECCHSFVLWNAECVASGGQEGIRVYNPESGILIHELQDELGPIITSLAVAGERCGLKPEEEVGDVGVAKVAWLVAGSNESICILELETERCVTTLHPPMVDLKNSLSRGVSVAPDWSRVVRFG